MKDTIFPSINSNYNPVQIQQSQESNPILAALEQAQEKAETDVDSLVEKETDWYSDLGRPIAERKGVRSCIQHPLHYYLAYTSLSPTYMAFITSLDQIHIPNSVQKALRVPESRVATLEELRALKKNGTWPLTNLQLGKRTVGCKWIFSVKHKANGSVERFKARLVATRFMQSYGIDYQETFAPVSKLNTFLSYPLP